MVNNIMLLNLLLFVLVNLFNPIVCLNGYRHEQVHLSLGAVPSEMIVTWTTSLPLTGVFPTVQYGFLPLNHSVTGYTTKFVDGGPKKRFMYIHRATMVNLKPGQKYAYRVGCSADWSDVFWFRTIKDDANWSPTFAVFGDLGYINGRSIPRLAQDSQYGLFDAILHVGDLAYNLDSENAMIGDKFMRQAETFAAYSPYMVTPGNHEEAYNFSNYDNRFSMMDSRSKRINNHFYSYNIGPAHIISFSTEFYFFFEYGVSQVFTQYNWLEQDLIEANKAENRALRPWIITLGHRPMYCNSIIRDDCTFRGSRVRKAHPPNYALGLEDLFYKYGVDLEIWGHEHIYERLWPIYNLTVYNGSQAEPYTNPGAPVHIITGSAGCNENLNEHVQSAADWSALRIEDYGFSRMTIHNGTHLSFEQLSASKDHKVVDSITIIKNKHGPFLQIDL